MSVEMLEQVRERMLPMLRLVAQEYEPRVSEGYPIIVDSVIQRRHWDRDRPQLRALHHIRR